MKPEQRTRQEKIDIQLGRAGWSIGIRRLIRPGSAGHDVDFGRLFRIPEWVNPARILSQPAAEWDSPGAGTSEPRILARVVQETPSLTLQLLRRVYHHQKAPFLRFIRHILGIEILESFPDTVSRSIDQFITEHPTLTSHQLQFLSLLRDFLIDRGGIEKRDLIQSPFTVIHPSGIRGVFSPSEINEILALTERLAS